MSGASNMYLVEGPVFIVYWMLDSELSTVGVDEERVIGLTSQRENQVRV